MSINKYTIQKQYKAVLETVTTGGRLGQAQGIVLDLFITGIWVLKFWIVDIVLLYHVGLPHVFDLADHLVIILAWWVGGIIPRYSYQ